MKKHAILIGIILIIIIGIIFSSQLLQNSKQGMIFEVTIPANTPAEDKVYVYLHTQKKYKMEKVNDFTYRITLSEEQLQPLMPNQEIRYRYSRNGYDFHTAEYLEPDTNDYFWTQKGRTTTFKQGKTQKDTISRWRWFPKEGNIVKTTSLEPQGNFTPRINNVQFYSGQTIEDLYIDAFHEFFNSTAAHIKQQGYNWVEIDPPWQWTEVNGFPKVSNEIKDNPNYPDDETFLEEVRAYKQAGLKVIIAPQLCCADIDTQNRSREWWSAYFDETGKFLAHFATLAQQGDADAFMYMVPSWQFENAQVDIDERLRKIWNSIRNVFAGEIGQGIGIIGPSIEFPEIISSPSPIPNTDFVTWGDQLDFFFVSTDYPLSTKDNPTDEELKKSADEVLDSIKPFYDKFKKPIIVRNGYFNVKYSWKGQAFYSISSVPWIGDPEVALKESVYKFDTIDHARTINGYFRAISERPWIIGYFHFGYTHWEDPLSPWMSIRGKPSEDIWEKWNKVIFSDKN